LYKVKIINDYQAKYYSWELSNTSFKDMQFRRSHDETIEMYHDANVYFQDEDKNTYIEKY